MNFKQSILNLHYNNIRKQNLQSISTSKACKDVSKYYKAISFSLMGKEAANSVPATKKNRYTRPLRIIVLKFQTPESCEKTYSIDISCFFNRSSKSAILKHLKTVKISKQFAHWIRPYGVVKNKSIEQGFNNINKIVGSDISISEYEFNIDLKLNNLPLTRSHISYIVAQTLCKGRYFNNSYQVSYTEHGGIIGAFILKNPPFNNFTNPSVVGYYISDSELKQCALANFTKRQTIEITQWSSSTKLPNPKFGHLLGDTSTSKELVRLSLHAGSSGRLVSNFKQVLRISALHSLKSPLLKLVRLLTKSFSITE
uniref:Uncharacterized protein n=1 Tax=Ulva fasciata TaxID=111617 RepID=A0A0U2KV26_9CHLO|nr:hypothetical protein [Ulva fasciata]ALG35709.1 hypothetical protein [Ulva fasciata]AML79985.1 hypothetical protein [Ulva fasciata]QBR54775.1 hypothetical protein [Ulva lactuca]